MSSKNTSTIKPKLRLIQSVRYLSFNGCQRKGFQTLTSLQVPQGKPDGIRTGIYKKNASFGKPRR